MNILDIDIPTYNECDDLTKCAENTIIDWTIDRKDVLGVEKIFKAKCKGVKKKRSLIKSKRNSSEIISNDNKSKVIKLEVKEEHLGNCSSNGLGLNNEILMLNAVKSEPKCISQEA